MNHKNDLKDGQGIYRYIEMEINMKDSGKKGKKHDEGTFINKYLYSFQKNVKKRKIYKEI